MRNVERTLTVTELATVAFWSERLFDAIDSGKSISFFYTKDTGEESYRTGVPEAVFGGNESKMSVFVELSDGSKKSFNVRSMRKDTPHDWQ